MTGKSQIKRPARGRTRSTWGSWRMVSPSSVPGDVTQQILSGSHFQTQEGQEVDLEERRWMCPSSPNTFRDGITSSVYEERGVDITSLNSSKTFHSVSFDIFIAKPVRYGLDKWMIRWVENWLDCWARSIVCNPSVIQSPTETSYQQRAWGINTQTRSGLSLY